MKARLEHVAPEVRETVDPAELDSEIIFHYSIPVLDATGDGAYESITEIDSNKSRLRGGEVLISKLNPRKARVTQAAAHEVPTVCSGEFIALRPLRTHPRYLLYLLLAETTRQALDARVQSVTRSHQRVRPEDLLKMWFDFPPLADQRAIADYLDRETARIDALIAAKRQMIELLEERLATAARVMVTAAGGVELPLKRRWSVIDCKHRTPDYVDEGYPVVSPGDTTPGQLDLTRCHRFVNEIDFLELTSEGRRPKRGDIIYSRNASIGIASYVGTDAPFCMGQDVCLITSTGQDQRYLTYVLNTIGLDKLEELKIGSTFNRINVAQIAALVVPCPPRAEQSKLADRLDEFVAQTVMLTSSLRRQTGLLGERRQALITVAVTGEIEITVVVA